MITLEIALDWRVIGAVVFGLLMFGVGFNEWVGRLGEHKAGYTALLVVVGVIVTLTGVALISWQAAAICAVAFVASGVPMIVGDIVRHVNARREAMQRQREDMRHE